MNAQRAPGAAAPTGCTTASVAPVVKRGTAHPVERGFAKDDYIAAVLQAKEYIAAGDMMQVQIGQRLSKPFTESPLSRCTARCAR